MPDRPNILFIMTDQHHPDYLGCLGHPVLQTPCIDALAAESHVFRAAYTPSPICGPARAAIFTGRYPVATGICTNWVPIADESTLMTNRLAAADYHNALVGKLHISPVADAHGFHHRRICDSPHALYDPEEVAVNDYLAWAADDLGITVGELAEHAGESETCGSTDPRFWLGWSWADDAHQMTTWTGNEAVSFLRDYDGSAPFFLHASFFGPHHPYATCEPWDSLYDPADMPLPPTLGEAPPDSASGCRFDWPEDDWRRILATYCGNIAAIDRQVGRILDTLRRRGLWDNTLIVFTADHGDHMGDFCMLGKGTMLESSVRVPLLVKPPRPAQIRRDRTEVVSLLDLYPTFLDYAGVADAPGRSLRRLLDDSGDWQDRAFASICSPDARKGHVMLIEGRYKAVGVLTDGDLAVELFDRGESPADLTNRIDAPALADTAAELRRQLTDWLAGGCPNDGVV